MPILVPIVGGWWKMSVSLSSNYNDDDEGGTSSASFCLRHRPRAYFNSPSRLFFALTDSRTECSSSSSEEEQAAPSYPPLHHRRYPLGEINFFLFAHSSDFFSQLNFILQGFHARTSTRSKQAHKKYKKTFSKVHFHKITPRTETLPE